MPTVSAEHLSERNVFRNDVTEKCRTSVPTIRFKVTDFLDN